MSEVAENPPESGETDAADAPQPAPAKKSKRKLIIIVVGVLLLLAVAGGAAWFFLGSTRPAGGKDAPAAAAADKPETGEVKFVDVPAMMVNLRSPDGTSRFLKVHLMLVPGPKSSEADLKERLPLLIDAFLPFLRERRPEDLAGSAAVFRIKEALMTRAAQRLGPDVVKDVLIQDLITQ